MLNLLEAFLVEVSCDNEMIPKAEDSHAFIFESPHGVVFPSALKIVELALFSRGRDPPVLQATPAIGGNRWSEIADSAFASETSHCKTINTMQNSQDRDPSTVRFHRYNISGPGDVFRERCD